MIIKNIINELPQHPHKKWHTRSITTISKIVIHHSDGWDRSTPFQTATVHIKEKDWPGVAYHYEIPFLSNIVLQLNYIRNWCYHTGADFNASGIGILVRGGFHSRHEADHKWTKPQPSYLQVSLLLDLVEYLRFEYNLSRKEVFGHYHANKKSCPGDFLEDWIEKYRS